MNSEPNDHWTSGDPVDSVDPLDEELVAYLDGELSDDRLDAMEQRLAEDETCRLRLVELQRTWDILDVLPQERADASFTQSTVKLVATSLAAEVDDRRRRTLKRRSALAAAMLVVALVAGGVGFAAVRNRLAEPNRQLMRDLPVIDNIDLYRNVDSITFLERLHEEGLFENTQTQ